MWQNEQQKTVLLYADGITVNVNKEEFILNKLSLNVNLSVLERQ